MEEGDIFYFVKLASQEIVRVLCSITLLFILNESILCWCVCYFYVWFVFVMTNSSYDLKLIHIYTFSFLDTQFNFLIFWASKIYKVYIVFCMDIECELNNDGKTCMNFKQNLNLILKVIRLKFQQHYILFHTVELFFFKI